MANEPQVIPISAARLFINVDFDRMDGKTVLMSDRKDDGSSNTSVIFCDYLEKGPIMLQTWVDDAKNHPLLGVFYVYMNRM
jgi:hypothetical protein